MEAPRESRNAMEVTFKVVFFLLTLPTALALQGLPPSLRQAPTFGRLATIAVCLGCFVSLVGLLARDRDLGLPIQRLGLVGVAFGAIFYAVAIALGQPDSGTILFSSAVIGVAVGTSLFLWYVDRRRRGRWFHLATRITYVVSFIISCSAVYMLSDAVGFAQIALAYGMSLSIGFGAVARRIQLRRYVHKRVVEAHEDEDEVTEGGR